MMTIQIQYFAMLAEKRGLTEEWLTVETPDLAAIYDGLAARRDMRIYAITADFALRPGPRLLLATEETCTALDRARAGLKAEVR